MNIIAFILIFIGVHLCEAIVKIATEWFLKKIVKIVKIVTAWFVPRQRKAQSELERRKIDCDIAPSHKENVAFDKCVPFCEKYLNALHKAENLLIKDGPTEKVIDVAQELHLLCREHSPWIPSKLAEKLDGFEQKLSELGLFVRREKTDASSPNNSIQQKWALCKELIQDTIPKIEAVLHNWFSVDQLNTLRRA